MRGRSILEKIALFSIIAITAVSLILIGVYPFFNISAPEALGGALAGGLGCLFTFIRPNSVIVKEDKEEDKEGTE
jgi:hypothetical protein